MTETIADSAGETAGQIWRAYNLRDRTLLTVGSVVSYWIFAAVAALFSIPRYPKFQGSLMLQPSAIVALVMAVVILVACVAITSMFAGLVHYEGGMFCAAIGLLALSIHGGPMRYVLMSSPGDGVFLKLFFELLVLFAAVWIGWVTLAMLRERRLLMEEPHGEADPDALPAQGAMAQVAQVILMIFMMILFAQTDQKAQVVWAVGISAMLAALAAHSLFPARPSAWFWTTPFIVGLIGYVLAYTGGNHLPGGAVGGMLPALARPLPLDYASIGVAGSLLGYWTSRRWHYERTEEPETPEQVEDELEHPGAG